MVEISKLAILGKSPKSRRECICELQANNLIKETSFSVKSTICCQLQFHRYVPNHPIDITNSRRPNSNEHRRNANMSAPRQIRKLRERNHQQVVRIASSKLDQEVSGQFQRQPKGQKD